MDKGLVKKMNAVEMKVKIDNTYMNVIRFGSGSKCLVIISGVSIR